MTTKVERATRRGLAASLTVDPLLPLACLVALAIYLPHGFSGAIDTDSALYVYGGQMVADGVLPYVDLFNRAGPISHLLPGVGVAAARLVGGDDIIGVRVLFLVLSVATIGLAYAVGRDLLRSRWAGITTAAAMLAFNPFTHYATYGPREKTAMVLLLFAAILAIVHQRWATTGVLISLATLTWQPVFFGIFAGAVAAVLIGVPTGKIRALFRLVVGGATPLLIVVAVYAAVGHLTTFLDAFVLVNARYTDQASPLHDLIRVGQGLDRGFGWSIWVLAVGTIAVLVTAARAGLNRDRPRDPSMAALVGVGVAQATGILWSLYAYDNWPDTFVLLPGAALGCGCLVAAIARRSPKAAFATTLAFGLMVTTMGLVYSVGTRNTTLDVQREDVAAVIQLLPDNAQIISMAAPQPLVLTHQKNPTRYLTQGNGMLDYIDETWPGGRDGFARSIVDRDPTVIAIRRAHITRWLTRQMEDYQPAGRSPGWGWFLHEDVSAETLTAVRDALK